MWTLLLIVSVVSTVAAGLLALATTHEEANHPLIIKKDMRSEDD